MSLLGPKYYSIPIEIKRGVGKLDDENLTEEEKEIIIEDIRKKVKQYASELALQDVKEVLEYLQIISNNFAKIINSYTELGLEYQIKKEGYDNELQLFVSSMFNIYTCDLIPDLELISLNIKVINIVQEELGLFLPPVLDSADGIVLRKIVTDTNE